MRRLSGMTAGITLLFPLALALPAAAAAPAAAPAAASAPAKKADGPFANFKIHHVVYSKSAKAGGKITYYFEVTNVGPYSADFYAIGGLLPKSVDAKRKIYWNAPKGTTCEWLKLEFWCYPQPILYPDPEDGQTNSTWISFSVPLKKNARGTAVAKLGGYTYDVPTGALDMDIKRIREQNIKGWLFTKSVKTKIIPLRSKVKAPPPPRVKHQPIRPKAPDAKGS